MEGVGLPLRRIGDFLLFRLVPREARFVAGFARAYTVDTEELKMAAAFRPGPLTRSPAPEAHG